jgi:tetratricopeptide (TPR) repeat protein
VYAVNKELGRIIEFPKESLEKDLLNILDGKEYQPNYSAGQLFLERLENNVVNSLTIDSISIQHYYNPGLRNPFELNSIGHVLLDQGKKQKALSAFQLNTQVFPSAIQTWNGLATAYLSLGRKQEARLAVDKGLRLDASNEETKRLSQLAQ